MKDAHSLTINDPIPAVIPFLDRYLKARIERKAIELISPQEDMNIRSELQMQRLQEILNIQHLERQGIYKQKRKCLFCPLEQPDLPCLFEHMFVEHQFNIGNLNNLVMVDEFLSALEDMMDRKICLYCKGHFDSRVTLKKHLKNKKHHKISSDDHRFDKHYIVNYINVGSLYDDSSLDLSVVDSTMVDGCGGGGKKSADDEEWSSLEDPIDTRTMCLLCEDVQSTPEDSIDHMKKTHSFTMASLTDCYDRIRFINYMRHCFLTLTCPYCVLNVDDQNGDCIGKSSTNGKNFNIAMLKLSISTTESKREFEDVAQLERHLMEQHLLQHPWTLPPLELWSKDPRYLFPSYEDDPLLSYFE